MLLYSDTIVAFIKRAEKMSREILKEDCGLKVNRTRFLYKKYFYPIQIVVFEKPGLLAYFDSDSYQIGIHKSLIYSAKGQVLRNLLRHEIAHYFTFIDFGQYLHAHGEEFKSICKRFSWGPEVSAATLDIKTTNEELEGDLVSEKMISKVQKLLSLAASSNIHEAQLATLKANQLLLKHNLEFYQKNDEEELVIKKIYEQKRRTGKMNCLYHILQTFMVRPIFNYGRGKVYIEVTGIKSNVSLAQYICDFLSHELERLWEKAQGTNPELKGIKHKNSFFIGVYEGYKSKIASSMTSFSQDEQKALIKLENTLNSKIQKFYRRLSSTSFSNSVNNNSHSLGVEAGRKLNIHRGINTNSSTHSHLLR